MELECRKSPIYSNGSILSPDGELLARVGNKRANWYLNKGLADKISEEPLVVQLKFVPKGQGNRGDSYMLSEKINQCVVCGSTELLTTHHIIPREFSRNFPAKIKERMSGDVIVMCVSCHISYEVEADKLKKELAGKYGTVSRRSTHQTVTRVKNISSLAYLLLEKRHQLPVKRYNEIVRYLKAELNLSKLTIKILKEVAARPRTAMNLSANTFGKELVQQVEDLQEFVELWRNHFLMKAQPSYMPEGYNVKRKVLCDN